MGIEGAASRCGRYVLRIERRLRGQAIVAQGGACDAASARSAGGGPPLLLHGSHARGAIVLCRDAVLTSKLADTERSKRLLTDASLRV